MNARTSLPARLALLGAAALCAFAGMSHAAPANGDASPPASAPASPPASAKPAPPAGQYGAVLFGAGSPDEGARLYGRECGYCHVGARNTGAMMLGRRLGADKAELHKRTDLDPDYVKAVVRNGLVNMPPFSKVELTDAELGTLAAWLARGDGK